MATTLNAASEIKVGTKAYKYIYNSTTSVVQGADTVFKINTDAFSGKIREVYFESTSPDCDIWLSEADSKSATSDFTIISIAGINLGFSPELGVSRYYVNRDGTADLVLYFTVSNQSATETGDWDLILTIERD